MDICKNSYRYRFYRYPWSIDISLAFLMLFLLTNLQLGGPPCNISKQGRHVPSISPRPENGGEERC